MSNYKRKAAKGDRVLVVDDEPSIVDFIHTTLSEIGYEVESYCEPREALKSINGRSFDLALIDINMPVLNGAELSRRILEKTAHDTEILIITGVPDEQNIDPCLKMGITNFLFKPFNESQLVYSVYAALHFKRLRKAYVESTVSQSRGSGLIGVSMSTRDVREEIQTLAKIDIPVLILGKSGTGKEVIAREIHNNSSRNVFMPVNCAVLGTLAETELFGHVSGAFTGAVKSTKGYIGSADGGTLFFDEVGELPLEVQAKLLRFLDNGEYCRVGEAKIMKSDTRILSATNRDLEQMCRDGRFREDLYYRLSASIIQTTPLDERKADIMPLIWHFLEIFGTAKNITYEISSDAASLLIDRSWPGNVRQLKQTLYKISQMASSRKISAADALRVLGAGEKISMATYKQAKEHTLNQFDREYFMKTLGLSQGSLQRALEISGMHKKNFYAKIKELGLAMKDFPASRKP